MIRLADVTRRADHLIGLYGAAILSILNDLTAEGPYVAALFDGTDPGGLQIYRELGFEAEVAIDGGTVLDILERPLLQALRKHGYVPIDEPQGYIPGTVMLYVFTRRAVVGRRFEKGAGPVDALREVRRFRDVEVRSGVRLQGNAALAAIVQRAAPMLKQLWTRDGPRVALIERASHGMKVGYVESDLVVETLRNAAKQASGPDRDGCLGIAKSVAAGPEPGRVACIIQGFGKKQMDLVWLDEATMLAQAPRSWDAGDDRLLEERITACREQKRALGLLEKCLDKLGEAAPASAPLAELIALVRHSWADCAAIEAQSRVVDAAVDAPASPAGTRLRMTLLALAQATAERKRGGVVDAN